mmetsp:Transcript_5546/g.14654  ORF Transcript_5546/g.14654 Transcript_5546/m.14654 type:complete len:333 (+) Transcript_5546:72-1070(+)
MLVGVFFLVISLAVAEAFRAVVSGATHGNELAGAWLLQQLEHRQTELLAAYPALQVETLLANPRAHAANVRFIDTDLNRMFAAESLSVDSKDAQAGYEAQRAKEIDAAIGSSSANRVDLLIDLHTTTTNMGCTLIVGTYSPDALAASAYVAEQWDRSSDADENLIAAFPLRVLIDPLYGQDECPYLCSIARTGIEVEIGPTPQGLLRADAVAATERAVMLTLEYFQRIQAGDAPPTPSTMAAYVDAGKLAWPHAENEVLPSAMVHPDLQGRDFEPLCVGDPLWIGVDGTVTYYDGTAGDEVVPIFINEAAYYHVKSGRGIGLCKPVEWTLPH